MIKIVFPTIRKLCYIFLIYLFTSLPMWYICHWYIDLHNEINDHRGIIGLQPDQRFWLMSFTTAYFIICIYSFILQHGMFITWAGLIFSNIYFSKIIDILYFGAIPPMKDTPTEFLTTGMAISVVVGLVVFLLMILSDNLAQHILERTYFRNKSS